MSPLCGSAGHVVPVCGSKAYGVLCEREAGHDGPHRAVQSEMRFEWLQGVQ